MVIAVDHGNKQIKTIHQTFISGLSESQFRPPFGKDVILYDKKYWSLSKQRITYLKDKTVDNRFFILTLFAIVKELESMKVASTKENILEIQLAVGLPPKHFNARQGFKKYFMEQGEKIENGSRIIQFQYNNQPFTICINDVAVYPQAYAASVYKYEAVCKMKKSLIIDIGGFTLDYLLMTEGEPDLSICESLDSGIITLYNKMKSEINSQFSLLLEETDIDNILQNTMSIHIDEKVVELVEILAEQFVDTMIHSLRERMIDLHSVKTFFIGGGSILLRPFIEKHKYVGECEFFDDVRANVKGYAKLYSMQHPN